MESPRGSYIYLDPKAPASSSENDEDLQPATDCTESEAAERTAPGSRGTIAPLTMGWKGAPGSKQPPLHHTIARLRKPSPTPTTGPPPQRRDLKRNMIVGDVVFQFCTATSGVQSPLEGSTGDIAQPEGGPQSAIIGKNRARPWSMLDRTSLARSYLSYF